MDIDPIIVEAQLQVLAVNFSNSYFTCVAEHYQTVFKNSNVVDEMEALDELSIKLTNRLQTTIIKKDRALLQSILESYTYLITVYQNITNVKQFSPNFKRYNMDKYLRDWCNKVSADKLAKIGKGIAAEVLNSDMAEKITVLSGQVNPDPSHYKSAEEKRRGIVKAEIAKILLNK